MEGIIVPVDREKFLLEARRRIIQGATLDLRLEGLTYAQRLEGLSSEEILVAMTIEQCLGVIAFKHPPPGDVQLLALQRLIQLEATHTLTSDMRKKLHSLLEVHPSARS